MKRLAVALMGVVAVVGTQANAGTVTFAPAASEFSIAPGAPNPVPDFLPLSIKVDPTADSFDTGDIVIGSDTLPIQGFVYDQAWRDFATGAVYEPLALGIYTYDLYVGGSRSAPLALSEVSLGVVTVDLRGLGEGVYTIGVDSVDPRDGNLSNIGRGGVGENLFGRASITIVPEPATLALLGIGAVAAMWRRRRTA